MQFDSHVNVLSCSTFRLDFRCAVADVSRENVEAIQRCHSRTFFVLLRYDTDAVSRETVVLKAAESPSNLTLAFFPRRGSSAYSTMTMDHLQVCLLPFPIHAVMSSTRHETSYAEAYVIKC
jgi:hypothetical protein